MPVLSEQITEAEPRVSTDDSFDDGLLPGHALHAEGQHHRQDRRQALGHGGHRQRHAHSRTSTTSLAVLMSEVRRMPATTTSAMTTTAIPRARPT